MCKYINMVSKFFLLTMFFCGQVLAGAWVHKINSFYVENSFGLYKAEKLFDSGGNQIHNMIQYYPGNLFGGSENSVYSQVDANIYIEYGIGYDFELNVNLPYIVKSSQEVSFGEYSVESIGDMQVGIKYKWLDLPMLVAAVECVVGIPTGNDTARSNALSGFPAQIIPTGDGEYDVAAKLHLSRGFQSFPLFVSGNVGFRFRDVNGGTSFANDLPWGVDAGYSIPLLKNTSWLNSISVLFAVRGLESFASNVSATNVGLIATGTVPGQSLIDIQPGLYLNLWSKLGLTASYSRTVWGENTGAGWSVRTGLAWAN